METGIRRMNLPGEGKYTVEAIRSYNGETAPRAREREILHEQQRSAASAKSVMQEGAAAPEELVPSPFFMRYD